jgi:hypothetical protein
MTHVELQGTGNDAHASTSAIRRLPRAHAMVLAAGMAAFGIVAVAAAMTMTL